MEKIMTHFCHDHPLTFCEEKYVDYKPNHICSMCTLPILSSPSYSCSHPTCAGFILHQPCAQLPQTLPSPDHSKFNIELKPNPPNANSKCKKCRTPIQNFTYILCSSPSFDLHPLCAKPVKIIIKHESHPQHPLVAIWKQITSECDACGEEHKGIFFSCSECFFFIHKDCASSPSFVKHASDPHPLILTYAIRSTLYYDHEFCKLCGGLVFGQGLYFCGCCMNTFHMKCVSSNMEILNPESQQKYWIHLPSEGDRFPSLINSEHISYAMNSKLLVVEKCHNNHPLTFHEKHSVSSSINTRDEEDDELCVKMKIISVPLTFLPSKIENYFMEIQLSTKEPGHCKRYFNSMFLCFLCSRPCNGFGCFFKDYPSSVCIECVLSPKTATHGSHLGSGQQHILFLTNTFFKTPTSGPFACCSRKQCDDDRTLYYSCVACDFRIHVGCALLPKKASHHEFDKHPLELVFTNDEKSFEKIEEDCDCFCEFCEEDIDQGYWFYRCAECEHSFHVKCVPSVGLLSRVKFGGSLNIPIHPRHPVILTRMLMEGNRRCGYCKEIVDGFVDDMAFRCDECDFWIHFRCARDCCSIGQMVEHELLLWEDVIVKNPFFLIYFEKLD